MAKKVGQYYYSRGVDGLKTKFNALVNGEWCQGRSSTPIVQLGIQALPGTRIYVGDIATPIIIGSTGIYELDIDGLTSINNLRFSRTQIVNWPSTATVLIDYIYEDGQGGS